jgi:5-methylcytosine-specific restriction endonuclease McrA
MTANISKALRNLVFERDSYTCVLCENPANDAHHLIPRAMGGRNIPENLISLCRLCHRKIHREDYITAEDYDELEYRIAEYLGDFYAYDDC